MAAGGGGTTMHILRIGAIFVLAAVASGAWAADVSMGGVSIKLPAPAGFCDLSPGHPADNRALTVFGAASEKEAGRLFGISADCQQLADWRAGKRPLPDDRVHFQTSIANMTEVVASPKAFIHTMCALLRAKGNEFGSAAVPDVKSKIEGAVANVKVNSQEFVGVMAEDDTACYAARIMKMRTPTDGDKTHLHLTSITVLKNKGIYVFRYAPYTSADATLGVLGKLKDTIAALHAANK